MTPKDNEHEEYPVPSIWDIAGEGGYISCQRGLFVHENVLVSGGEKHMPLMSFSDAVMNDLIAGGFVKLKSKVQGKFCEYTYWEENR